MNSKRKQQLLKELQFDGERCAKRREDPGGANVRWKLAASFKPVEDKATLEFGLSEDGDWVVPTSDGSVRKLSEGREYLPLYPLLEVQLPELRTAIEREFRRHGISLEWLEEFPYALIAASALTSGSKYWPDDALRWTENLPLSGELENALRFLRQEGRTQNQRHRAAKLLRRFEEGSMIS